MSPRPGTQETLPTFRLIVEQMQKGVATLSAEGVVLYCNPYLASLVGIPLEQLIGSPFRAQLDDPAALRFDTMLEESRQGRAREEIRLSRRDSSILAQVSLTTLPTAGEPVLCMIVTDLTDRERREDERSQLRGEQAARAAAEAANRTAHREIERRTRVEESLLHAELDRQRLFERERAARREVEEASRLKDEFLATLSHELRTPLSAIMAWAHVLRQPGLDATTKTRALEAIDRNARIQSALVADLLDVSRIVTGKFHMSLAPVDMEAVIASAIAVLQPAARIKDIAVSVEVEAALGSMVGDASRLRQVVWNLLSNAIRFAPVAGCVQVRVWATHDGIELRVTDDGGGVEPAFLPYVFDRFRQADSSSTRRHAGMGLGLAIARHLVELHGGSIHARNRDDRSGAVFTVRLPRPQVALVESLAAETRGVA